MYYSAHKDESATQSLTLPDDVNYLVLSERTVNAAPQKRLSVAVLCMNLIGANSSGTDSPFTALNLENSLQTLLDEISIGHYVTFSDTGQLWITLHTDSQEKLVQQVVRLHSQLAHPTGARKSHAGIGCFTGVCFALRDGSTLDTLLKHASTAAQVARQDAHQLGGMRFFRPSMIAS